MAHIIARHDSERAEEREGLTGSASAESRSSEQSDDNSRVPLWRRAATVVCCGGATGSDRLPQRIIYSLVYSLAVGVLIAVGIAGGGLIIPIIVVVSLGMGLCINLVRFIAELWERRYDEVVVTRLRSTSAAARTGGAGDPPIGRASASETQANPAAADRRSSSRRHRDRSNRRRHGDRRRMLHLQAGGLTADQRQQLRAAGLSEASLLHLHALVARGDADFTPADYELLLRLDEIGHNPTRAMQGANVQEISQLPTYVYRNREASTTATAAFAGGAGGDAGRGGGGMSEEDQIALAIEESLREIDLHSKSRSREDEDGDGQHVLHSRPQQAAGTGEGHEVVIDVQGQPPRPDATALLRAAHQQRQQRRTGTQAHADVPPAASLPSMGGATMVVMPIRATANGTTTSDIAGTNTATAVGPECSSAAAAAGHTATPAAASSSLRPPDDDSRRQCQICLDHYEDGDSVRILPCMHSYHTDCIDVWLRQKANCPVCKSSIRDSIWTAV